MLSYMFEKFRETTPESVHPIEKSASRKDFDRYKKWLELDEKQLQGKVILDVGSGDSQFGEYVEQHYPDTKVLRFDVRQDPDARVDFVARADKLALKEESIDLALAHASISNSPGEYMVSALKEIFSTIKDGGEIRVTPLLDVPFELSQERLRLIREYVADLENQGLATAEWKITETGERTTPKYGTIHETRYLLIIKKVKETANPNKTAP